jgi:dethiobiotin synthetase
VSSIFVTAIGTGCGKTHVSAAVLRELAAENRPALALKPLMSGYSPEALEASDAGRLLQAMDREISREAIDAICWKRFTEWSAPNVAARKAGVLLSYSEMLAFVRTGLARHSGPALVEGAGGVMSPLTDAHTNIDLMSDLRLPVMLLAANYLGAVSHTLTALESLSKRDLQVRAIVVTQTLPNAGLAAPFIEELQRWTDKTIVEAGFSRTLEHDRRWAGALTRLLFPSPDPAR